MSPRPAPSTTTSSAPPSTATSTTASSSSTISTRQGSFFGEDAVSYARLRQNLVFDPNTIAYNDDDGIDLETTATGNSIVNLYIGMSDVSGDGPNLVNGNGEDGLDIDTHAYDDAFVDQVFNIRDSHFNNNGVDDGDDGVSIDAYAYNDSTIFTDIHFVNVSASGNADDGIDIDNGEDSGIANMDVRFRNTTVGNNGDYGVVARNYGGGATLLVSFGQGENYVDNNPNYDIQVYNSPGGGLTTLNLTGVDFGDYDTDGVVTVIGP